MHALLQAAYDTSPWAPPIEALQAEADAVVIGDLFLATASLVRVVNRSMPPTAATVRADHYMHECLSDMPVQNTQLLMGKSSYYDRRSANWRELRQGMRSYLAPFTAEAVATPAEALSQLHAAYLGETVSLSYEQGDLPRRIGELLHLLPEAVDLGRVTDEEVQRLQQHVSQSAVAPLTYIASEPLDRGLTRIGALYAVYRAARPIDAGYRPHQALLRVLGFSRHAGRPQSFLEAQRLMPGLEAAEVASVLGGLVALAPPRPALPPRPTKAPPPPVVESADPQPPPPPRKRVSVKAVRRLEVPEEDASVMLSELTPGEAIVIREAHAEQMEYTLPEGIRFGQVLARLSRREELLYRAKHGLYPFAAALSDRQMSGYFGMSLRNIRNDWSKIRGKLQAALEYPADTYEQLQGREQYGYEELVRLLIRRGSLLTAVQADIVRARSGIAPHKLPMSQPQLKAKHNMRQSGAVARAERTALAILAGMDPEEAARAVRRIENAYKTAKVVEVLLGSIDPVYRDPRLSGYLGSLTEPLLTAAEEVELAKTIEAGVIAQHALEIGDVSSGATDAELTRIAELGEAAEARFIRANLRLVVTIAKRYRTKTSVSFFDLIQEGNMGLARAVKGFDYTKGYKFSTYAVQAILHDIVQAIRRQIRIEQSELSLEMPVTNNLTITEVAETHMHATNVTPDETIAADSRVDAHALLQGLSGRDLRIVRRHLGFEDGEQWSFERIGKAEGVSGQRMEQRYAKLIAGFRHKLSRD